MISLQEAISEITSQAKSFGIQTIPIDEAFGRVLAQNISAKQDSPPFNWPMRDGAAGKNIAMPREGAQIGRLLIKNNKYLDASSISVLAATGYDNILAEKLPEVAIISTGNEIVPVGKDASPYQIRDSNSYTIQSFLKKFQIHSPVKALVPDNKMLLKETISHFLDKDVIIISGGVSKGDADYVPEVLTSLGVKEIFHGVKLKPGAPLWFGYTRQGGVIFGLPGNPLSVQTACRIFIEPYLCSCFRTEPHPALFFPFFAERKKKSKFDEYFPCTMVTQGSISGLLPLAHNGSGDISSTLQSDGIALHAENIPCLAPHTPVPFYFW